MARDGHPRIGDDAPGGGRFARKDRAGNITITGRIKDIINRGGEKISALDIENRLTAHPQIEEAAVVGMPDAVLGERICAYVRVTDTALCFRLSSEKTQQKRAYCCAAIREASATQPPPMDL